MLLEVEALLVAARGTSSVSRTRSSAARRSLACLVAPMAWTCGVRGEGIAWLVAPMAWPRGVRGEGIGLNFWYHLRLLAGSVLQLPHVVNFVMQ